MKNDFYVGIYESTYLSHHGIDGMKWGVQNGPPYPLDRETHNKVVKQADNNLKNAKTANLDKWGKSRNNNILYITGRSGSGKSTLANSMKDKNTQVIHLDLYIEKGHRSDKQRNKAFDAYLKSKNFDLSKTYKMDNHNQEKWKMYDEFAEKHLQEFGRQQYDKGKKVIVEGVQISDDTLFPNKKFFKGKPMIVLQTNSVVSDIRGAIRDNRKLSLKNLPERYRQQKHWTESIKKLEQTTGVKRRT